MRTLVPVRARRRTALSVALFASAGLLVSGLPALAPPAVAAPNLTGKRCDQLYLNRTYGAPVAGSGIQGKNQQFSVSPEGEWSPYFADNPSRAYDGLKAPTADQQKLAGNTRADIDKWKTKYEQSGNTKYRVLEIYARYGQNLAKNNKTTIRDFSRYVDVRIAGNEFNRTKGHAFAREMVQKFRMVGPDWLCEVRVPVTDKNGKPVIDPKTGKQAVRIYDFYNRETREFGEFKSNGKHIPRQLRWDRHILRSPDYPNHSLRMVMGEKVTKNTRDTYRKFNAQRQRETGRSNGVTIREQRSNAVPRWKPNQYTRYHPHFNPSPTRVGTGGPLADAAYRQGQNQAEAKALQKMYQGANTRGGFGRPGGVDFSTLELNYVGHPTKSRGIDYSFRAGYVPNEDAEPGYGGEKALTLASDAFFTWLALTPDRMWVNLNPDQPDKIMDNAFAHTDAGRILLEADMEMKRDWARAMDPNKSPGREFMNAAPKVDGTPCWGSGRNWIVPHPAKVREQDGGIYILDAPLKVNTARMDFDTPVPGERCDKKLTKEQRERGLELMKQLIIPTVEKQVNTDAKYRDLRTVYRSRVAAEWVRQQDAKKATEFRTIINSNDLKRWPLRAPHEKWDKRTVWEQARKSFTEGEFTYKWENGGTIYTFVVGGVDFSKAPKRNISQTRFTTENPRLDRTTKTSVTSETAYRNTETAYLGGSADQVAPGGGDQPGPSPTPTPSPTPSESETSTPTPSPTDPGQPTTPPAAHVPDPSTRPSDQGGQLPDTGSDTPITLIAGLAAALAAAGATLTWWVRRRTTTRR
ncbi:LPXTG cell wall anchor domain-containing protein [Streptomyces sp. NPDC057702]|uniref:LPXTG cell wall anchor domain-containing protein n=1 Tax=unclassified Streptomyces TaxID=2593676 RepID=UPI0036BE6869